MFTGLEEKLKSNIKLANNGKALRFAQLQQDDSRTIQCNVSNTHGYLWIDFTLTVHGKVITFLCSCSTALLQNTSVQWDFTRCPNSDR